MEDPPCVKIGYRAYIPRNGLHLCIRIGYSWAMYEDRKCTRVGYNSALYSNRKAASGMVNVLV